MLIQTKRLLASVVCILGACSNTDPVSNAPRSPEESTSPSATEPASANAKADLDLEHEVVFNVGEISIAAGTESMHCHYLPPLEKDLVVRGFSTHQSKGGHHMVVYRALQQKPPGTVEECSSGESMSNLMLALTQTGTQEPGASAIEFPEDHVVVLKAGMQFVAQSHYINMTNEAIVTSDMLTLHTTDADLQTLTQLHLFVAAVVSFEIPAFALNYSARAGCTLDKDINVLSLTPHMHEWGSRIQLEVGSSAAMSPIFDLGDWRPEMRDQPPTMSLTAPGASSDGRYKAGNAVVLTCTWRNTESHALKFPNEMCAMVGYFTSDDPDAFDVTCVAAL